MAGQPEGATWEERRRNLNQDGSACGGAPPPPRPPPPPPGGAPCPGGPPCPGGAPCPGGPPRPAGAPRPSGAPRPCSPPHPGCAPHPSGAPPRRQGASSNHAPPAYDGSDRDSDDSDNPRPPVRRCLYGGPGSTSRTGGSGTTRSAGGVVRQGNLVGGVGCGMGDGSGSKEGDARGTQGDHDTGHVGTGGGGGSSSRVVTGAVRGILAQPGGTGRSGAGVSCRTPRTPVQPTRGRSWCGFYGAPSRSEGPGGSG